MILWHSEEDARPYFPSRIGGLLGWGSLFLAAAGAVLFCWQAVAVALAALGRSF